MGDGCVYGAIGARRVVGGGGVVVSCAHALKELGLGTKMVKRGGAPADELV